MHRSVYGKHSLNKPFRRVMPPIMYVAIANRLSPHCPRLTTNVSKLSSNLLFKFLMNNCHVGSSPYSPDGK
jgi:hypothetical protein